MIDEKPDPRRILGRINALFDVRTAILTYEKATFYLEGADIIKVLTGKVHPSNSKTLPSYKKQITAMSDFILNQEQIDGIRNYLTNPWLADEILSGLEKEIEERDIGNAARKRLGEREAIKEYKDARNSLERIQNNGMAVLAAMLAGIFFIANCAKKLMAGMVEQKIHNTENPQSQISPLNGSGAENKDELRIEIPSVEGEGLKAKGLEKEKEKGRER